MNSSESNTLNQYNGLFTVILGPDGSGKSTLVEQLLANSTTRYKGSWHFHWRPGLLPQPGRRAQKKTRASAPPPDEFAYGKLVSLLRYSYFLLDFILGYWLVIYPRCKRGQLVIGERWYFDVLISPQRYGFRLPAWLLRFGGHLIPKPDLTVLLTADPDAIHKRKPELTVPQITTQIIAMRSILPANPYGVEISTDVSPDGSVAALLAALKRTSGRIQRVYGWRAFPRFGSTKVLIGDSDTPSEALRLYNPYSVAGRIVKKLACLLPRALTTSPATSSVWHDDIQAISPLIRATLGGDESSISFATGTPGPHRKMTAQVRQMGRVTAYVKIAQSAAAIGLLKREANALTNRRLQTNDRLTVPHVIAETDQDGYHLLFLSAPETASHSRHVAIDSLDIAFIEAMTPIAPAKLSLDEIWHDLSAEAHCNDDIVQASHAALESMAGSTGVRVCPAHGDFAPWNTLLLNDNQLFVFDWEYYNEVTPLLNDLFHRTFMPDWLVRRLSPAAATYRLIGMRSDQRFQALMQRLDIEENEFNASLLLYLLRQSFRNADDNGIPEYIRACLRVVLAQTEHSDRRLKVLVSAYACEPDKGSEPGVGWNWAEQISQRAEVWAITKGNNRASIEAALRENPNPNMHFSYIDLPRWASFWKKGGRGIRTYYYLWQFAALIEARRLHKQVDFDLGHHVTFVNDWLWSFMALLPFPFVWGPIGSNTTIPPQLLPHKNAKLQELIRRWVQRIMRVIDPLYWLTVMRARTILVLTREVSRQFPLSLRSAERFIVEPAIAISPTSTKPVTTSKKRCVLYVGKFLYIKNPHLVIDAFGHAARKNQEIHLLMIGEGPEEQRLRAQTTSLGLESRITFSGWKTRDQVLELMSTATMLLFPSAEGAGMVTLEALASGLPVVCLELGGAGQMVTPEAGIRIPIGSYDEMAEGLAEGVLKLCRDPELRARMSEHARNHACTRFVWADKQGALSAAYALALAEDVV